MSWMDSWSRPSKSQATPAPYYLIPGSEDTPYCKYCGRVISQRKSRATKETATPVKYCSSRCRSHRINDLDKTIEQVFVAFLNETTPPSTPANPEPVATETVTPANQQKYKQPKRTKGDLRLLIPCDKVEEYIFGSRHDPEKTHGRKKNKARRGAQDDEEWKSVDMMDTDASFTASDGSITEVDGDVLARLSIRSGTRIRPSQDVSEVNGSVGGEKGRAEKIEEDEEMLAKRREGERRAEERERVRCAARRGVVFGFGVGMGGGKGTKVDGQVEVVRKCEAVMLGKVVEPSFAKGDWGVRWREE
ncbi:hypothetical protein B0J11DRAFT_438899 [Dendryphion nanum]|uniref:Uncharacterized protein n=1 Tax=Dendryphion nanum TaxID=256645 RepID=A0A9P9IHP3_9PLEO|nr:hypothetical protein B0J11DRAFT_438899 [Dendryphion nanum]